MARIFDRSQTADEHAVLAAGVRTRRSTAHTVAAAVSALLVSLLVVSRSEAALGGSAASLGSRFGSQADAVAQAPEDETPAPAAEPDASGIGAPPADPDVLDLPFEPDGSDPVFEPDPPDPGSVPDPPGPGQPDPPAEPPAVGQRPGGGTGPPEPPVTGITLVDDTQGSTLFDLPAMVPGAPYSACTQITYGGSLPAMVSLHGAAEGNLASQLRMTVEAGRDGTFAECGGFFSEGVLYDGTLAAFADTYGLDADGLEVFRPSVVPTTRSFRITVTLDEAGNSSGTTSADFVWGATTG